MKLLVLLSLLTGQAYYEWVDQHGESHFTDDPSAIPSNAKRRVMERVAPRRGDAGVPALDAGARGPAPALKVAPQPAGPDSCERARKRLAGVEAEAEREKAGEAEREKLRADHCMRQLQRFGEGAYAQCRATQQAATTRREGLARDLEAAQDELRRAQVGGCR